MWQKMGIAPMQLRGCDLRQAAACRHDAPLQFRSRLHGSEKTLLIRSVCGIRRRLGFALVRYLRIGFFGGFAKRLLVRLALLLLGQNDRMVHDDAAIERLADVDVVLVVVMHGQRIDLRVREAVAAALLDIVQNKGDAVVEVFMLLAQEAAKSASAPARCSRYSRIVSRKCSLGFVIMVLVLVRE